MTKITAETPFGELMFTHQGAKVSVQGEKEPLAYWAFLLNRGLYGAYGFTFDPDNCFLSDLTNALVEAFDRENVSWDKSIETQLEKEMTIPPGAIP